ncbi:hypothetical protein [Muricoccus radiodurans]|uniref:hypothetical protein n=1 Tax=Muricoccus radiodurans TaxID=2231721 RepID=UPI003CED362B
MWGAASLAMAGAARAQPALGLDDSVLLVPGPEDGGCVRWAGRVAASLARALPVSTPPRLTVLGGPDGVTAANRFGTLEAGDGKALLVLPGAALHARLIDPGRARFDPGSWVALLALWQGAVLAGRGPLAAGGQAPLRVAIGSPDAPEAAALAALDLLRVPARPVTGPAAAVFSAGQADALIIAGADPVAAARAIGATPWFRFAASGEAEGVPVFQATSGLSAASPEMRAVLAAVAAVQLRASLVLPALTSANLVAAWRRASLRWQEEARAEPGEGRALAGAEAAAALAAIIPTAEAVLAWRTWLDRRLGWRPG